MKAKALSLAAVVLLGACVDLSTYTNVSADATPKERMKACMLSEANTKLQNGTLFANTVQGTADELVNTCIKKLALQSAGISSESQTTAENIINNLKNLSSAI